MNLEKVFKKIYPNKEFVIINESLNDSFFIDKTPTPTLNEAKLAWEQIQKDELNYVEPKIWTPKQFLEKFTQQERIDIIIAAKTDPIIEDFRGLCSASTEIISNDPLLSDGMNYLIFKGLITETRKNEILL